MINKQSITTFVVAGLIGTVAINGFAYILNNTIEPNRVIIDFMLFGLLGTMLFYLKRNRPTK